MRGLMSLCGFVICVFSSIRNDQARLNELTSFAARMGCITLFTHLVDRMAALGQKLIDHGIFFFQRGNDVFSHLAHLRILAVAQLHLGHIYGALVVRAHHHGEVHIGVARHLHGRQFVVVVLHHAFHIHSTGH